MRRGPTWRSRALAIQAALTTHQLAYPREQQVIAESYAKIIEEFALAPEPSPILASELSNRS